MHFIILNLLFLSEHIFTRPVHAQVNLFEIQKVGFPIFKWDCLNHVVYWKFE